MMKGVLRFALIALMLVLQSGLGSAAPASTGSVVVIEMDMMILPGTQAFLEKSIARATAEGAELLIVQLNTPGGVLGTAQKMVQAIFDSPVPVVIYVGPSGGSTATSAGVFITLAGHVAAMAPGTSMGSAHPVGPGGDDIQGDMRKKVEEMAIALVKSIAERRGRNVQWAEESVRESSSITEREALSKGVVDLVAEDLDDLLARLKGKEVRVGSKTVALDDYSRLPRVRYEMGFQDHVINVLANPNVAALLWLGATAGISLELYNPGTIVPGVIGVICLVLALAVSQIIPVSSGGILLLVLGAGLLISEMFFTNGFLGVAGIVAIVLGSLTLIDIEQAPGMQVDMEFIIPVAALLGALLLLAVRLTVRTMKRKPETGLEALVGMRGEARGSIGKEGKVFVDGELWNAMAHSGLIPDKAAVEVVAVREGLLLEVKACEEIPEELGSQGN